MDEVEALAKMKAPLVRLRGQWIALSSSEIQKAFRFWQSRDGHQSTLRDIVRMQIGTPAGGGPELDGVEATGQLSDLLGQLSGGDSATSSSCAGSHGAASHSMRRSRSRTRRLPRRAPRAPLNAGYRVALTGTPVENHLGDLWSIMEFLNPGFLGTLADFKRDFFIPIQVERDDGATQRLRRATGPFMLRRVKTDRAVIADLPDKFEGKTYCALTSEQASLYRAVLLDTEESLQHAEGIDRRGSHPRRLDQTHAGLQPPRALPRRRLRDRRTLREAQSAHRDDRGGPRGQRASPGLHPFRGGWAKYCSGTSRGCSAQKRCSFTAVCRRRGVIAWSTASTRPAVLHCSYCRCAPGGTG